IALARLLRERQPALFDTLYAQRGKHALASLVDLNDPVPLVHVSGQFGARRSNLAVVLPLAVHPGNKNEIICADLSREPDFLDQTAEQVRRVLFAAKADLPADTLRPPLKTVKLNRAPVLLPATWVAGEPAERLGLDGKVARAALAAYRGARQADPAGFKGFIQSIYAERKFEPKTDPDTRLYDGFLGRNDEALLEKVRDASPAALATESWVFEDGRLPELLFRYRARNFPDSLSDEERDRWQGHCRDHLLEQLGPGWQDFHAVLRDERSRPDLSEQQTAALQALADYAEKLQATHARW
ncbi:MAG: exodeoxyribonuclease I, partial [Luminiphilus sp.]